MGTWPWDLIRDGLVVVFCMSLLARGVVRRLRERRRPALPAAAAAPAPQLQAALPPSVDGRPDGHRGAPDEPPFRLGGGPVPPAGGRYDGVRRLAREGLGCRQIAERLNLPRGEVELALKLQPLSQRVAGGNFCPQTGHQP
ncbi:MAG: DUF2802 domain-containing protein [Desulfobacterales bacterium]|nr:DUF2802 domain-containing protein [Desulfobacterales bacterium]